MSTASHAETEALARELLDWVDGRIEVLQGHSALLERVRECVVSLDTARLDALIAAEAEHVARAAQGDRSKEALVRRLAAAFGLRPAHVTLGRLRDRIEGPLALALEDRRERLLTVARRVHEQAAAVGRLVRFSLDLDGRLLAAMAGADADNPTYSASGAVERRPAAATVEHSA